MKVNQGTNAGCYRKRDIVPSAGKWLFLFLIILLVASVRARLLDVPLERDEGEYAYMGQLLLQGIPPYSEAYNMKFPGVYIVYAGIMSVFGQSVRGIHLGFMLLNCVTVLLVFLLTRKIANDFAGIAAGAAYGILSLSSSVFGFAAHATHFVALPAVGGALALLHALERKKLSLFFLSGTLFALSCLMKQPGFFFLVFGASYILYDSRVVNHERLKKTFTHLSLFTIGALLPFLGIALWLFGAGVIDKFWFWTMRYAAQYAFQVPLSESFTVFRENFLFVVDGFWLLWMASALGVAALFSRSDLKRSRMFIIFFTAFSFLSICPGFYFRPHYFVSLLPAVSLLIGIFADYFSQKTAAFFRFQRPGFIMACAVAVLLAPGIAGQKDYFFRKTPLDVSRDAYGSNPFPESVVIAKFINARTDKTDRIAVLGSEPQIYFYSKRLSATGHIYTYGLMERHDYALSMQKEMIREIEASNPKILVLSAVPTSWLVQEDSERHIFAWLDYYIRRHYRLVGVADIVSSEKTIYQWQDDAEKYTPQSPDHVLIFERKKPG